MPASSAYRLALHALRTLIEAASVLWLLALSLALLGWAVWIAVHYPAHLRDTRRRPALPREAAGRAVRSGRPRRAPGTSGPAGGPRMQPRPRRAGYERGRMPEPAARTGPYAAPRAGWRPGQD